MPANGFLRRLPEAILPEVRAGRSVIGGLPHLEILKTLG